MLPSSIIIPIKGHHITRSRFITHLPLNPSPPLPLKLSTYSLLPFCSIDDSVFGVTVEEITLQQVMKEKSIAGFPLWAKHALAKVFAGCSSSHTYNPFNT